MFTVALPTHCPDEDYLVSYLKQHDIRIQNKHAPWEVFYSHEKYEVLVEVIKLGWMDDVDYYIDQIVTDTKPTPDEASSVTS